MIAVTDDEGGIPGRNPRDTNPAAEERSLIPQRAYATNQSSARACVRALGRSAAPQLHQSRRHGTSVFRGVEQPAGVAPARPPPSVAPPAGHDQPARVLSLSLSLSARWTGHAPFQLTHIRTRGSPPTKSVEACVREAESC